MYVFAGLKDGERIPEKMEGRHVHFGPPVDWFWKSAQFDSDLMKTLETWTLQYVIVQPILAFVHIFLHSLLHHNILGTIIGYASGLIYVISTTLSLSALIGFCK